MKFARFLALSTVFVPCVSYAVGGNNFQSATQLLTAARRGDTRTVQALINSGADINYTDATGLSLVCTAVMNNDTRAIQVLQMYGADASRCDRQIKNYRQKSNKAKYGEETGFFSGLSSSHVLALSAVGVAAVIGGVAWLTDWFDADNNNDKATSGGSHSGGGGGGGSSGTATKGFTTPYGPAYLNSEGVVNTNFDITENLANWDSTSLSELHETDFNYLRIGETNNFITDGVNQFLQNYLLMMGGYYSLASGYMGQNIFRDSAKSYAPVKAAIENAQARPVRVALITGNGINPAGSADSADGIVYAISTSQDSSTPTVDKYLNNSLIDGDETENSGYDFSGSGSAFNPYANVNDSALAKIVAGWEGKRASTDGDLYGFVPNGQLAIYRTGNGSTWQVIENATDRAEVGTFSDVDHDGVLSDGDDIVINSKTYNIVTALSLTNIALKPTIEINGHTFDLSTNSKILVGKCENTTDCTDIAIYVGTDGAWYVNSTGGNDIDSVYLADEGIVYNYKTQSSINYANFSAMTLAAGKVYNIPGDPSATTVDVIANTNVLPVSKNNNYLSVDYFTTMASIAGATDLKTFYRDTVNSYYGNGEGGVAHSLFNGYSSSLPMIIMPAGERVYGNLAFDTDTNSYYISSYDLTDLAATFENYAPMVYGTNLKHDFMTVIAVNHKNSNGTSSATTITGYGDGSSSAYGPIVLSKWADTDNMLVYSSRKCGIAGSGSLASNVDPWCFAASGPTAEMATASAAGAVASVKAAFANMNMTNDQVFTLLALTADGPFLGTSTSGTRYNQETLVSYLKTLYELPLSYNVSSLSDSQYLEAFKDVFGYGLINLERAIKPGFSVYYYSQGNIVSASGNQFWGNVTTTSSSARASTILSLTGRSAITTSFYDIIESVDGELSLPRVWSDTIAMNNNSKHALYMGDVLGDFDIDSNGKQETKVGNITFNMSMSQRAYNDNLNGLDNLKVSFTNDKFDISAEYQHYLTDGESRFNGRANGVLSLASNVVSSGINYKTGKFSFGGRAFSGIITDESLLENDPVLTSQFEPARLGLANGGAIDVNYKTEKFNLNTSLGTLYENNTVLGMYSDGLLEMRGGNTIYVDAVATYKPFENVKLSLRSTFAETKADANGGMISSLSDIRTNSFAFGADISGFSFTASMPLAVTNGKMGYEYAEYDIVENDGRYQIALNNPHTEYIDLSAVKREIRFATSYKQSLGDFTDAGVGFIYRVNPNNTDAFGNESIMMFKIHHRLGI